MTTAAPGMTDSGDVLKLIDAARAGQPDSLGQLLEVYANYLRILAATQLDTKLRQRVSPSDIVQETYCEAHRDIAQFRGNTEKEFVAWLRQILIHNLSRCVEMHILTEKRDVRRELSLDHVGRSIERSTARMEALLADNADSPSKDVQHRERAVQLADYLAKLPDDYREVIILRNFQGLPFKEVAKRMGRNSGAVRMLWLRALRHLRTDLDEQEI